MLIQNVRDTFILNFLWRSCNNILASSSLNNNAKMRFASSRFVSVPPNAVYSSLPRGVVYMINAQLYVTALFIFINPIANLVRPRYFCFLIGQLHCCFSKCLWMCGAYHSTLHSVDINEFGCLHGTKVSANFIRGRNGEYGTLISGSLFHFVCTRSKGERYPQFFCYFY